MSSFLRRYSGPLLLFAAGAALIAVAPFVMPDRSEPPAPPPPSSNEAAKFYRAEHTMPGARLPPAVSAAASGLTDTDEVIGIVVRGKARAYTVQAMAHRPRDHVINDLVNGTPVTVTYNNLGRFVRVYGGTGSEPLDVRLGGTGSGDMILEVDGRQYVQRSGDSLDPQNPGRIPLDAVPAELTYWKKWRDAHPDTDVVVSVPKSEPAGGPATSPRP